MHDYRKNYSQILYDAPQNDWERNRAFEELRRERINGIIDRQQYNDGIARLMDGDSYHLAEEYSYRLRCAYCGSNIQSRDNNCPNCGGPT